MKTILFILLFGVIILTSFTKKIEPVDKCDVSEFYKSIEPNNGVKALTSFGELKEVELLLVPTKMEEGLFKIDITRKGSNIYKVEGTSYYIETRICYEYATFDKAVLKVESNYGYNKGTILFNP